MNTDGARWRTTYRPSWSDSPPAAGFLFVNQSGEPLNPSYVTHTFRRRAAEADLPPIRLPDPRQGAASRLSPQATSE